MIFTVVVLAIIGVAFTTWIYKRKLEKELDSLIEEKIQLLEGL